MENNKKDLDIKNNLHEIHVKLDLDFYEFLEGLAKSFNNVSKDLWKKK